MKNQMNQPKTGLLAVFMLGLALTANIAGAKTATRDALHFTMLFSNNVAGEAEPCG